MIDYFLKILSNIYRVSREEEMTVNKGSKGSPASTQAREAEVGKGTWEGRRRRPQRGVVLSKAKEGSPSGTAEGPPSPKAPTGQRSRCGARPAFFPVPSSSSFPPGLLSFCWPSVCRSRVGGGKVKIIKEFLTSSYQAVKPVVNVFNKTNNTIISQGPC